MGSRTTVWIASYPRSGNTLLRTILWNCFGLRSASIYANDLGGNKTLEEYVGHIEYDVNGKICFPEGNIPLIKTHKHSTDDNPAIYIIRDGRAACVSLWEWCGRSIPLNDIISGRHKWGSWSSHVQSWNPWHRPNTLLLEYEDMKNDLPTTLNSISNFLKKEIINEQLPDRNTIARIDGRWVRPELDWRTELSGSALDNFYQIHEEILRYARYI